MAINPSMGCSVPNMVQRYLGTEYDTVKKIADNLEAFLKLDSYLEPIVIIADKVPSISGSANWFINNTTGRVYCKVTGVNGTYWVESNSSGRL